MRGTGGTAVAVTDEALLADQRETARLEGSLICPEGAACVTAVRQLRESGWLAASDEVVVLNTGTGLKYPDLVAVDLPVLAPGDPLPEPGGATRAARRVSTRAGIRPGHVCAGRFGEAGGHGPPATGGCFP